MNGFTVSMVATVALLSLTGCEKKANEVVQTVDWYKEHTVERKEMIEKCKADPGQLAATPNCVNANRAASAITWGAKGGIDVKPLSADELKQK